VEWAVIDWRELSSSRWFSKGGDRGGVDGSRRETTVVVEGRRPWRSQRYSKGDDRGGVDDSRRSTTAIDGDRRCRLTSLPDLRKRLVALFRL
jgi:hypothetical protein